MENSQIYKIYINAVAVILKPSAEITLEDTAIAGSMLIKYTGNKKHLLDYIKILEKSLKSEKLIIHFDDFQKLKADFKSHFNEIEAAGGLVVNEKKEFLFIFRNGSWDLPKGHIESDETKKATAMREVTEETGVKKLTVTRKLMITKHAYRNNEGKRIIKKSHWYLMETKKQNTVPQTTEDIALAEWMTLEKFYSKKRNVYPNIVDVLQSINTSLDKKMVQVRIK